jgi:aldehyde dehydrogenase (NAD+)
MIALTRKRYLWSNMRQLGWGAARRPSPARTWSDDREGVAAHVARDKADTIYIDGSWRSSSDAATQEVLDSTDGSVMAVVASGTKRDADEAAIAAERAFPAWSTTPAEERAAASERIAAGLRERAEEIADIVTRETGMPRRISLPIQVEVPIGQFERAAVYARDFEYEEVLGNAVVVREPVGVVAAITPWNYPLNQIAAKVAPALAAGCTVALKPAAIAPLDAVILAEVIDAAGVPKGVFNLVTGSGKVVGNALVEHPAVAMISFTGSTTAGREIAARAAQQIKRVTLELGGKSANVILDDLDAQSFEKAVRAGVGKCYINSGQTCTALTRMLVPRSRLAEAEQIACDEVASKYQPGQPFERGVRLGPLASRQQVEDVTAYVRKGIDEGAKLIVGGAEPPDGFDDGFFVRPTIFSEVSNDMTIAQEEIFGPVLSIIPYGSDDEAVEIANDSPYGLSGGVSAASVERARGIARRMRTGAVEINGGAFNPEAPFGGYKQSGYGRENGRFGFEEFLELKALQL